MNDIRPSSYEAPSSQQQMETVWRDRARRLSLRPNLTGAEQDAVPVVVLGIGKERYGVDLQDVAEVFPPIVPTPVPGAGAVFAGVVNVHGEIRPVIDLRQLLGLETAGKRANSRVVLLRRGGRELGLQIDSVEQIRWIGSGDAAGTRSGGTFPSQVSVHIKGSTKDLLMLLKTEALFAQLEIGVTS
jgi:chemotaxis signal transduction protein